MNILNDFLNDNKQFKEVIKLINNTKSNGVISLAGTLESQKAHVLSTISNTINSTNIIICESEIGAKSYFDDLKFFLKDKVFYYPSKDIIFYSADVKSTDIIKRRFEVIKNILENKTDNITIVLSIEALFDRLVDPSIFQKFILNFRAGDLININDISNKLLLMGYEKYENIEGAGQFAVRGGIIDIFSPIFDNAFRIELYGDEIDSIRIVDVVSGRSIENTDDITIYPMRELVYEESLISKATENILCEFEKTKEILKTNDNLEQLENLSAYVKSVTEQLKNQKIFSGVDRFIQFFYEDEFCLLDYVNYTKDNIIIFYDEPARIRQSAEFVKNEFDESLKGRILKGEILPCQVNMIFDYDYIIKNSEKYKIILMSNIQKSFKDFHIKNKKSQIEFNLKATNILKNSIEALYTELNYYKNLDYTIVFLANSTTKCERLEKEFNENGISSVFLKETKPSSQKKYEKGIVYILRGSLNKGFEYPQDKFVVIADKELFGEEKNSETPKNSKKSRKKKKENRIQSFMDLKVGDYVVHENHGISIFKGIEKITTDGMTKDYLKLGYEDDGILYVSVNQLDMVQKYTAGGGSLSPKLNKLGGKQWGVAKAKAKKAVKIMAKDLVLLYAKRKETKGFIYSTDNIWQTEFEDNFPFDETDDQINAIQDVKKDMESGKVMDRLICGDVGFGKTEVAIRAAFKAVQDNKQVVFLVPTTILAQQHYQTFIERMKAYSINVEMLSRFRTPKQQKQTIEGLKNGNVNIVVGTHRILSKDIVFSDLGLVIVDEEQRFGVKHKDKLKHLRENVDILTLSATPIPRTLHMSMTGIRDMSLLEEPPRERTPVQTYVLEYDAESIRNAINRELGRGGQVYYLHNRVNNIEEEVSLLQRLVPDANISFAHGRMSERELEKVMIEFLKNNINVLVCTTIIETGLDISNVNTIIINNADKMGLSQLYQLRGRVGRSNKTSFAYLMYKKDKVLQVTSEKRLQTIREFTEFGSGFKIAMRDLEIRGAGNLLGAEQHGHMDSIGYDMYCKLLDAEIKKLQGIEVKAEFETIIDLVINAFIPNDYIANEVQKLEMYKKISSIKTKFDYSEVQDELEDRFGNTPKAVYNLLNIALMKAYANNIGVTKVSQTGDKISIKFNEENTVNIENLKNLISSDKAVSFDGILKYAVLDRKDDFVEKLKEIFLFLA